MKNRDLLHSKGCDNCGDTFYRDKRCTWAHWGRARFCSRQCAGTKLAQETIARRPELADAFWAKVDKRGPDECWSWMGLRDSQGYGQFPYAGVMHRCNRISINLSGRDIPSGMYGCHKCGNTSCVNPSHLYPGTPTQNSADKILHGTHRFGEMCHTSKLTEAEALIIKADPRDPKAIALDYGVGAPSIKNIKTGRTWKHLP